MNSVLQQFYPCHATVPAFRSILDGIISQTYKLLCGGQIIVPLQKLFSNVIVQGTQLLGLVPRMLCYGEVNIFEAVNMQRQDLS